MTCVKRVELLHSAGTYDILIGGGLVAEAGQMLKDNQGGLRNGNLKCGIISDDNVFEIYGGSVLQSFESAGFTAKSFVFKHGEAQKTLATVSDIYNFLCENNFNRDDFLVALGGGVVGDITGFAAATYLRGIKFIQMPTTLLAQVDSSVGGKTGVDLPFGKNLVGAFYQPSLVLCDTDTLDTLSDEIYADGMGEVIKHGCIANKKLFYAIKSKNISRIDMIYENIKIKAAIVSSDERESKGGERIKLNFGHTIGHAIEKYFDFSGITHGAAISIGMIYAAKISHILGLCGREVIGEIGETLKAHDIKPHIESDFKFDNGRLVEYCQADKKAESAGIKFVLLTDIGKCTVEKIPLNELRELLNKCDKI